MSTTQDNPQRLAALLAWYCEMGVTAALDPEPVDWRARGNVAPGAGYVMPAAPPAIAGTPNRNASPVPAQPATSRAREQTAQTAPPSRQTPPSSPAPSPLPNSGPSPAQVLTRATAPPVRAFPAQAAAASVAARTPVTAGSLAELAAALANFEGCGLKSTAKSLCLYRGAGTARLMIIGEAPGRDEDLAGKPFAGPAGQLLDRMLAAISMTEADVHITNVVYWRPPGNRDPTPQEALACAPFLARQIELVAPDVILLLGGAAAKHLLATDESIMKLRGKWRTIESAGRQIKTMATLHPAYVLRAPASKRQVWRDLLAVRATL